MYFSKVLEIRRKQNKQFNEGVEKIIHELLRFSNIKNEQLNNKEIVDKINLISNLMDHIPSNMQAVSSLLLSFYLTDNDIFRIEDEPIPNMMKKVACYHFKKLINDIGIWDEFCSHFNLLTSEKINLPNILQEKIDKEGLNIPMFLIDKFPDIEQVAIFLISYQIFDPEFIFYKIKGDKSLHGHSFITYITKKFQEYCKKQTDVKKLEYEFEKYQICFIFSLTKINESPKKNDILNQIVDEEYRLLDIIDEIILELYIKCCENYIKPDESIIENIVVNRCILAKLGSVKSDIFAPEWTSALRIGSTVVPFPRKEYLKIILPQFPSVLNKFYENEKKLEITEYNDELFEDEFQYYDQTYEIALNALPKNSQKIYKMVQISRKDISRFVSNKNVPYFLDQMDIHFLHDCKTIITDYLIEQYNLIKPTFPYVHFIPGHQYKTKKDPLKNNEHIHYYSGKSTIKDFAYDYVRRICSLIEINKKFNINDDNENEYDKYINDFENISINLPDLKINGLSIPMYMVNQKIANLSSFLAAYEQIDPKFAIRTYKRSGDFSGFSVLSFVLHNFLLDIENINNNLMTNYIESIYVILNNLECQPAHKKSKVLCSEKVDNLQILNSIIDKINNSKSKFEKGFIDKKISELNDLSHQYMSLISK